jgi:hypothetical protein
VGLLKKVDPAVPLTGGSANCGSTTIWKLAVPRLSKLSRASTAKLKVPGEKVTPVMVPSEFREIPDGSDPPARTK